MPDYRLSDINHLTNLFLSETHLYQMLIITLALMKEAIERDGESTIL